VKKAPWVSVLMPVRNGGVYLLPAVRSILAQTLQDLELVVVDDGSTDGVTQTLARLRDPRLRVLKNPGKGLVAALNFGVSQARGRYLARMDSDDLAEPQRLEQQASWLEAHPDCALVASRVQPMDADGDPLPAWPQDAATLAPGAIRAALAKSNCLAHPSVMLPIELLRRHPYDPQAEHFEDYALWLRLAGEGLRMDKLPAMLLRYRMHAGSVSSVQNPSAQAGRLKDLKAKALLLRGVRRPSAFHARVAGWATLQALELAARALARETLPIFQQALIRLGRICAQAWARPAPRVVAMFPYCHVGGAEKVHVDVCEALADLRPLIQIHYPSADTSNQAAFQRCGPTVFYGHLLRAKIPKYFLLGWWAERINQQKPVAVIGSNTDFFYKLLPLLAPHVRKVDLLHAFGGGIEAYTLPYAHLLDARVVITPRVKAKLKGQYRRSGHEPGQMPDHVIIRNKVALPENWSRSARIGRGLRVLYVGRGSLEKRPHLLGRIAQGCRELGVEATFVLAGPGIAPWLTEAQRALVSCPGMLSGQALWQQYAQSDILLMTSSTEGFPVAVQEAMLCGLIPVLTAVGGIPGELSHMKNAWLLPAGDDDAVVAAGVQALARLAKAPALQQRLAKGAEAFAKRHYLGQGFRAAWRKVLLVQA
jgi:glycosyltransferase involved in cell wall biosynthesis